jgi:hypothetical protein
MALSDPISPWLKLAAAHAPIYEAALFEVDPEILPRRIGMARKAIHLQIVKLHKMDEAGDIWALMDALKVLDDLILIDQADLSRRALA